VRASTCRAPRRRDDVPVLALDLSLRKALRQPLISGPPGPAWLSPSGWRPCTRASACGACWARLSRPRARGAVSAPSSRRWWRSSTRRSCPSRRCSPDRSASTACDRAPGRPLRLGQRRRASSPSCSGSQRGDALAHAVQVRPSPAAERAWPSRPGARTPGRPRAAAEGSLNLGPGRGRAWHRDAVAASVLVGRVRRGRARRPAALADADRCALPPATSHRPLRLVRVGPA
jgi:hypothetical protein